jgi:putative ABC transport system ATP-binding protein
VTQLVSPDALISIRRVSKDYVSDAGLVRALREVDLFIESGEFVAIVGTSGSGKSTLMNILGCLDRPTRGTYTLAGVDAGARTNDGRALVRNRMIGFIFQGFNLLPRTTALENCELPLQYRGVPTKERRRRAMGALEAVGLGDRVHHTPNQLSGGQQQRVAIARALVTDPPLLLADEPTGNLDSRTSYEVLALLQRLNRDRGITIVLVTHEPDIAACASRVVHVRDGRIVSDTRNEPPIAAAVELAKLPPADKGVGYEVEELTEAEREKRKLGGPVPFGVPAMMLVGAVLGSIVGNLYNAIILDAKNAVIPLLLALLTEAWLGVRTAKKKLGKPLTFDQRARLSLGYTVTLFATVGLAAGWFLIPKFSSLAISTSVRVALALAAVVVMVVVATLARFALLTFFSKLAWREPSSSAAHGAAVQG